MFGHVPADDHLLGRLNPLGRDRLLVALDHVELARREIPFLRLIGPGRLAFDDNALVFQVHRFFDRPFDRLDGT